MANTISYGMGQYRYTRSFNYISKILEATKTNNNNVINYYENNTASSRYQDIVITLPDFNGTPLVQYGETYYMRLTLPQNYEYETVLNLKLCPYNALTGEIDIDRYQYIKRLIIPAISKDINIYKDTLLYEVPNTTDTVAVAIIDSAHDYYKNPPENKIYNLGEVYKEYKDNNIFTDIIDYKYVYGIGNNQTIDIINSAYYKLLQSWLINDENDNTITYEFAFSPKYNLSSGYSFLFLETSRENAWSQNIQFVGDNQRTYYGTFINKNLIEIELYKVANLLERGSNGYSQIQSGSNTLNHIGVWGHPEQIITINGEEIKIGQSGFYELNDYTISSLGMIVYNPDVDKFTIDYEYKINN